MRTDPRPFAVYLDGRFQFTLYAYTLRQARRLVEARLAGAVVIVAKRGNKS
jgi:hypothetical protein